MSLDLRDGVLDQRCLLLTRHPVRAAARSDAVQTRDLALSKLSIWQIPDQRSSTACCIASGMTSQN
ncbi:MAG: hypothetical protein ACFCUQ_13530, partial [Kiloniellales bacterium]